MTIVHNIWLLMEFQSHTMSAKITHNTIMILICMLLDSMTYITDKRIRFSRLHSYLKTLLGNAHQLLLLWSCLAYDKHS